MHPSWLPWLRKIKSKYSVTATNLVEGGAGACLAESVLAVTSRLGQAFAGFPEEILIQSVCHGDAQTEAPEVRQAGLLVPMSARLSTNQFTQHSHQWLK